MIEFRLDNQGNEDWGSFSVQYNEKEYQFPYYIPSGEIFNHDPPSLISFKCVVLTVLTPLISIIRSVYWLGVSIFLILAETYRYLDGQGSSEDVQIAIYESSFESVRGLGYGTLMMGCAFVGIFAPYQGRLHYGWLERELNHHSDGPHRNKIYAAICFQRLFVLAEDGENSDQAAEKITKYLTRIDTIFRAFWSCSYQQLMVELRGTRSVIT